MTIKATTKALLGTAVSFALLSSANVASAADLDNLSDDDLLARIERLEKIIGPGDNFAVRSGTDKVRVTLNGHINRTAFAFTDGTDFEYGSLDNTTSNTRFRILGSAKLNDVISVKTRIEASLNAPVAQTVSFTQGAGPGGATIRNAFGLRYANFQVIHKNLGAVTIGQGDTATNGSYHRDLSGTFIAGYSEVNLNGGGIQFRTNGVLSGITAGAVTNGVGGGGIDGGSREDVIRYDTPRFGGFGIAVSATQNDEYAVAGRFRNKDLAGFSVDAELGYTNFGNNVVINGNRRELISGSIAIKHNASGFNGLFAGADDDQGGRALYGKFGWTGNIFDVGSTSIAGEYGNFRGAVGAVATTTNVFGALFVQKVDSLSTEFYASYRNFSLNNIGAVGFSDIHVFQTGARVKF